MSFVIIDWDDEPSFLTDKKGGVERFSTLEEARRVSSDFTNDGQIFNTQLSEALLGEEDILRLMVEAAEEAPSWYNKDSAKEMYDKYIQTKFKQKYEG